MSPFELVRSEAAQSPRERKKRPSIRRLCILMNVSTSGFYDWKKRPVNDIKSGVEPEERLVATIRTIQEQTDWTCGSRRLQRELRNYGEEVGRRRIRRLLREYSLYSFHKKRFKKTTDSKHSLGYSPNLLEQNFSVRAANEVWVSDITYVWTSEGWSYLATVIDLCSRRVVGWAYAKHMRSELVVTALKRAIELRRPPARMIVHTDRRSQYASARYRQLLREHSLRQSMSGTGNCYDNAVAESFFASLKKECVSRRTFTTRTEAFDAIESYIEGFYNPRRLHSGLGYVSPINYEQEVDLPQAA